MYIKTNSKNYAFILFHNFICCRRCIRYKNNQYKPILKKRDDNVFVVIIHFILYMIISTLCHIHAISSFKKIFAVTTSHNLSTNNNNQECSDEINLYSRRSGRHIIGMRLTSTPKPFLTICNVYLYINTHTLPYVLLEYETMM